MLDGMIALNQDEIDVQLAQGIKAREQEIANYQIELQSHEQAILEIGDLSWTPELEKYRRMGRDQMIIAAMGDGLSQEQIMLISDLQALDMHRGSIMAVNIEMGKARRAYNAQLAQLPEGARRDAALEKIAIA